MKIQKITLLAFIALFINGCTNKNVLDPSSADAVILNKTAGEGFEGNFNFPSGRHHGLFAVLDLSEEQRTQIQEIIKTHRDKAKSMRGSFETRPSIEEIKTKRQEMRESIQKEIYAVLSPEQQTKLDELKAQLENGKIPDEIIELQIKKLDEKLNLTEEQKIQIKALEKERTPGRLKPDSERGRDLRQKRREEFKVYEEKMLNILTPEQQAVYQEMKVRRKETFRGRRRNFRQGRAQNRYEKLVEILGLDATQAEQLKEIFANVQANLRDELKGHRNGRNREEIRQAMREKIRQVDEQIQRILNDEQLAKYNELKSNRPRRIKNFH